MKRAIKSTLSILLVVAAVLTLCVFSASAEAFGGVRLQYTSAADGAVVTAALTDIPSGKRVDYAQFKLTSLTEGVAIASSGFTTLADDANALISSAYSSANGMLSVTLEAQNQSFAGFANYKKLFSFKVQSSSLPEVFSFKLSYVLCFTDGTDLAKDVILTCAGASGPWGDVNFDGVVDIKDILRFKRNLADSLNLEVLDINCNGSAEADDLVLIKKALLGFTLLSDVKGDVNADRQLNDADITALEAYLSATDGRLVANTADLNGDGVIDGADLAALKVLLGK